MTSTSKLLPGKSAGSQPCPVIPTINWGCGQLTVSLFFFFKGPRNLVGSEVSQDKASVPTGLESTSIWGIFRHLPPSFEEPHRSLRKQISP